MCAEDSGGMDLQANHELEQDLRQRLRIPLQAQHVLIMAETSHWDPSWIYTSEEYFQRYVARNLDRALDELLREPRRVYSLECIFFLRMYWERRPERRPVVRELLNQGRLRLTNSGVTTADTLLPDPEAILRDFLMGQEWLRVHGIIQEPRVAYFPDSFGCSPTLPSLLNAAGFTMGGITRIDGMSFPGCELAPRSRMQTEGTSADILMRKERTLDFVWRDPEGGEILCHWNAFTYGQGDLLAHLGISRVYLFPVAVPFRSEWNITRRLRHYVRQLLPYSRTPYLFCPIGFDFIGPIPDLVALLDRQNELHYARTGVWAVNAGIDDYLALVDCHRHRLPVLMLDPNPYWTGFYTSRLSLKAQCHELVRTLKLVELRSLLAGRDIGAEMEGPWWEAVVSNHHDFITGTSTDRVVEEEQRPSLVKALAQTSRILEALESRGKRTTAAKAGPSWADRPVWRQVDGVVEVEAPSYHLVLAEEQGGCVVSAVDPASGRPLLRGPSFDLVVYLDGGGLWRMGHEYPGGRFRELDRASAHPIRLVARETEWGLEVGSTVKLDGQEYGRRLWLRGDQPRIGVEVSGWAPPRRTVTLMVDTAMACNSLTMDAPGGVIERPLEKRYRPTFWPLQTFVQLHSADGDRGVLFVCELPGAVACRPGGKVEIITQRNATHERAFGFLMLPGMPISGHENLPHQTRFGLDFAGRDEWGTGELQRLAREAMWPREGEISVGDLFYELARQVAEIDPPSVTVMATKPAWRGEGWIVRLYSPGGKGQRVRLSLARHPVSSAFLCDARERDVEQIEVQGRTIAFEMPGCIATLRLVALEVD